MAAPTPGSKPSPGAGTFKMPDGYQALLSFSGLTAIGLWIQTVKFGGLDGGEKINTTTMMNSAWRTFAARQLKTKDDTSFKAAFDPDVLNPNAANNIYGLINNDAKVVTEFFPDGSSWCYYGYLQKFGPPDFKEGDFPTADFTVTPTNWDKSAQVEAGPVFTPASGT